MIRRVFRRRPRRFALLAVAAGLVVMGVASVALALVSDTGTADITVQDNTTSAGPVTLSPSGSASSTSAARPTTSLRHGHLRSVRASPGRPSEKGYNTDGAVAFDTKSGTWTHAIKVNAMPVVDCDGGVAAEALPAGSCSMTSTSPTRRSASR